MSKQHEKIVDAIYRNLEAKARYQEIKRIIATDKTLDEKTLLICDLTGFLDDEPSEEEPYPHWGTMTEQQRNNSIKMAY